MSMHSVVSTVKNRDLSKLKEILRQGASPDAFDQETGENALAIAAFLGDEELVQILLDNDADPNFLETTAWPLSNAAGQGHVRVVEMLLDAGAEVDSLDEDGGTALMDASAGGYEAIVRLLIEHGADVRRKDRYQKRAIYYAANKGHEEIVNLLAPHSTSRDRKQAKRLLEHSKKKPRDKETDRYIRTYISAAREGDFASVEAYLNAGGDIDAVDSDGATAAFHAANTDNIDVLKFLVESGTNVNHLDLGGAVPLTYAAMGGASRTFDYLLPITQEEYRKGPQLMREAMILHRQWEWDRPEIDQLFREQCVEEKLLQRVFDCALWSYFDDSEQELLRYLEENQVPANVIEPDGTTLLMRAAGTGKIDLVKKLVNQYHLDPNATNKFGHCALDAAAATYFRRLNNGKEIYEFLFPLTRPELRKHAMHKISSK